MSRDIYASPDPTQTVIYKERRPRDGNRSHRGDTVDREQLKLRRQEEERGEHIYESLGDVGGRDAVAGPQEVTAGRQPRGQSCKTVRRVVALCLGMMCLTLLVVFTGLTMHYKLAYEQLQINYNNLTLERNELQTRYDNLALERDILTIERDNLTLEKDILTIERDNLTLERDILTIERDNLTLERDNLTLETCNLTLERDNRTLETCNLTLETCNLTLETCNLTLERDNLTLERCNLTLERDNLTLERNELQTRYDNLTLERDILTIERDNLTLEIKDLTLEIEDLTLERDNLTLKRKYLLTKYKDMTPETNTLLTKYNKMTLETSNLLTKFNNMTLETKMLLAKYNNITLETRNLLTKFKNMTLEINQLESWSAVCGVPAIKPVVSGSPTDGLVKEEAVPHSWPWQVFLQNHRGSFCGGSLINKDWVVTGARCKDSTTHSVILGQHNLKHTNSEKIRIGKVFIHPKFNIDTIDYDIALIKLERPAQMNERVSPVCVAETSYNLTAGMKCVATGWGLISHSASWIPDKLHQVCLPLISNRECNSNWHNGQITSQMLCAGASGGSTCDGDGGGPLVCEMNGTWTLVGVNSWGDGCSTTKPDVYSSITALRAWMDQTMDDN